ncbi:MAG: NAD(P)(+) transhydrogenase (Re/Si-specific) subunit beta [Opitutaceae bacterium]|jgi:NAD(P) transhydrogenase subunit beta|nr:NAD(P)(+) transhydrogenase (Re/Si-specific) subunit beta [Opitutaceae bacterium]
MSGAALFAVADGFRAEAINLAYIVACALFILGIKLLGKAATARRGNLLSSIGMLVAVVAVLFDRVITDKGAGGYLLLGSALALGAVIGAVFAARVKMTGMPELVALLNGFGGLASFLVAWAEYSKDLTSAISRDLSVAAGVPVMATIVIGGVTFSGSMLAWGKLSGRLGGRPVLFKGRHLANAALALALAASLILFCSPLDGARPAVFYTALALSLLLGVTAVLPIGGGDMPVVISLLNSLSGMAAASTGFILRNNVLIVSGCLVGASGVILTVIMCKAMNRSVGNLLFGGFGAAGGGASAAGRLSGEPKAASVEDAFLVLEAARSVVIIPGYGMAVAQAQHAVRELGEKLEANGAEVKYAIHPVAGRMPGHMNVLLAEADVPYEQLCEMDAVNPALPMTDVAIVIGANDVVNPAAATDKGSPIYGMPIIRAHEARTVFVLKRGRGAGFSGIENELFLMPNTRMLYGDAKATVTRLVAEFGK